MKKFLFSLDCELGWAEPDPPDERWNALRSAPSAGRNLYRKILDIFRKYEIPATWAFVGHLFLDECTVDSHYVSDHISAYDPYTDRATSPLYYGDDLIRMVRDDVIDHEIAGHSFSHIPYSELTTEEARQDLEALVDVAESSGYELSSFVFPTNQIAHTELLADYGFTVYRGHMQGTGHTYKSGLRALLTDPEPFLYTPPTTPRIDDHGGIRLPTSRLLRDKRWWFLQPSRLKRGIASMESDQHIHFTIHPHNFLDSKHLFRTFDSVLSIIAEMRDRNQIEVATMSDITEYEADKVLSVDH
jgi:peptidoglycan/xylan/chitin deacetylase (PgdA/CDA1 family)